LRAIFRCPREYRDIADFSFTTLDKNVALISLPIPRIPIGQSWEKTYVGIALINLDNESATLTYVPHDTDGNQLPGSDNTDVSDIIQPMEQSSKIFEKQPVRLCHQGMDQGGWHAFRNQWILCHLQ